MLCFANCVDGMTAKGYASGTLYDEFCKILMGDRPHTALRHARDTQVLQFAMPEIWPMCGFDQGSRYHDLTTDEHTFVALETAAHVDAPLRVRWALLFHDAGKPDTAWKGDDGRMHYYAHGEASRISSTRTTATSTWTTRSMA
jgi:tRNA nucleotidyltransferase (CCA-adding enzyme)